MIRELIYGPLHSRRLGQSLGVNLLPREVKICTFDCVYCECGMSEGIKTPLPTRDEIVTGLRSRLEELKAAKEELNSITFSGHGEATLHPDFETIIDDTMKLRDEIFPSARIAVLSNATNILKPSVFRALNKVDDNILKLDSAINTTMRRINLPHSKTFSTNELIQELKTFNGNLIIQTIFIRGEYEGHKFDNTTEAEVEAWLWALSQINPKKVMIYALDRPAPVKTLEKVSLEELNKIAHQVKHLGMEVIVAC